MRIALALGLMLFAVPAAAQRPSFNCAKASAPVEHAICADPQLAGLDRRIATAYADLLKAAPKPLADALRDDQRTFLYGRDEAFALPDLTPADRQENLQARLEERAGFLEAVQLEPAADFTGQWHNAWGSVDVRRDKDGTYRVTANGADPVAGYWSCFVEDATGAARGRDLRVRSAEEPGWSLSLALKGTVLQTQGNNDDGSFTSPFCGMNGTLDGAFFRTVGHY